MIAKQGFLRKNLDGVKIIYNFAAVNITNNLLLNHNKMNAIKKTVAPDTELTTTTLEVQQNCILLEESKHLILDMVHKHFRK